MDSQARRRQALSFGPVAEHYDRVRPSYPVEAITWLLGDEPRRVVDLGAGTGIFSRQLAACGHDVVPVEPDPQMRQQLAASAPELAPLAGTAEAIPLPDASVDAVTAAQAYHWFDPEPTHREVARVLRPGGTFGPLWNFRDDEVAWVAELSRLLQPAKGPGGGPDGGDGGMHQDWRRRYGDLGPEYEPTERALFRHAVRHTADSLVELVRSRSYYLTAEAQARAEIEANVRDLVASHPDLAGRTEFDLRYVTVAYRARRVSAPV